MLPRLHVATHQLAVTLSIHHLSGLHGIFSIISVMAALIMGITGHVLWHEWQRLLPSVPPQKYFLAQIRVLVQVSGSPFFLLQTLIL